MLQLFQFIVLNMTFSVIGAEIANKLASIGGLWFNFFYVWVLYAVFDDWQDSDLPINQIGSWFVMFFMVSSTCMLLNKIAQFFKFNNLSICSIILNITSKLLQLTFPYILWRYVYLPTRFGVNFGINYMFGTCDAWYCTWGSILLAVMVTGAVVSYTCQSPAMKEPEKTKRKYTQRVTPIAKRTRSAGTDTRRSRSASRR